jgi:hypothetical protein
MPQWRHHEPGQNELSLAHLQNRSSQSNKMSSARCALCKKDCAEMFRTNVGFPRSQRSVDLVGAEPIAGGTKKSLASLTAVTSMRATNKVLLKGPCPSR